MNILSLGAGVQSSTVLLMSCRGMLPKLDCAIFADTGWEPKAVYDWLEVLQSEADKAGIPIHRVGTGTLREDALRSKMRSEEYTKIENGRWASMPLFTLLSGTVGQIRRQCTNEYKIQPIEKKIRELWGDQERSIGCVSQWMGISGDEQRRIRTSRTYWIMFYYPLVFAFDKPMHRHDCQNWLKQQGFDAVPRSSCLGCPYHSDKEWREIQARSDEWEDVVAFDEGIRHVGGQAADTYLHRSCKPLPMIDFRSKEERGQQNWLNECEGMCGV
jgi:hypothetical protein